MDLQDDFSFSLLNVVKASPNSPLCRTLHVGCLIISSLWALWLWGLDIWSEAGIRSRVSQSVKAIHLDTHFRVCVRSTVVGSERGAAF